MTCYQAKIVKLFFSEWSYQMSSEKNETLHGAVEGVVVQIIMCKIFWSKNMALFL
jgi:hypothetical protein